MRLFPDYHQDISDENPVRAGHAVLRLVPSVSSVERSATTIAPDHLVLNRAEILAIVTARRIEDIYHLTVICLLLNVKA